MHVVTVYSLESARRGCLNLAVDCNMGGKRRSILRAVELWEIPIQAYSVTSCGVNIVSYLKVRVASLCIVG